jgi:hypothetical protein
MFYFLKKTSNLNAEVNRTAPSFQLVFPGYTDLYHIQPVDTIREPLLEGMLSTVDLLIKKGCFRKEKNILSVAKATNLN